MIKLIGIPYDGNSSFLKGAAMAPRHIRLMEAGGSSNCYAENGTEIKKDINYSDLGDIEFTGTEPEKVFNTIKQRIQSELINSDKIISLGGDHSVTYPVIDAFSKTYNNLNILHIDAHADLYENFDNNPFSHASPFARIMEKGLVNSLTQVGIRTLTKHQRNQALKYGVRIHEMKNFNFEFISDLKAPLYLSIDIDALDPAFAPGVSHHEPGGITVRDMIKIIQNINKQIVGADIVEYNPTRDINNMTAMVAYKLMKEIMTKMLGF